MVFFMVRELNTIAHRVMMTPFLPAWAGLSCYGQQTIPIDVVSKIPQSYLCPGPDDPDCSHHKVFGHHRHHAKHMLNPAAYLCSLLIPLLFSFGKLAVSTSLALHSFSKSPLRKEI
jgi:hypothetical protein